MSETKDQTIARLEGELADRNRQLDVWEANEACPECGEVHICSVQRELAVSQEKIVELTFELSKLQVKPIVDAEVNAENRTRGLKL